MNSGNITLVQTIAFCRKVLDTEGHKNIKVEISDAEPSICLNNKILLRKGIISGYRWQALEEVLHEIAHVDTLNDDKVHGTVFYEKYAYLIKKYLAKK